MLNDYMVYLLGPVTVLPKDPMAVSYYLLAKAFAVTISFLSKAVQF